MAEQRPTKKQRREQARAERLAAEQAERGREARRRRGLIFGALLAVAALTVVVAVLLSSNNGADGNKPIDPAAVAGAEDAERVYGGIAQRGTVLGEPSAKVFVTIVEQPKCPGCRQFDQVELPQVVSEWVRTGKARIDLKVIAGDNLGADQPFGGRAIVAAAKQNRMFQAAAISYANQGAESTEWMTPATMRSVLGSVKGLDVEAALRAADDGTAQKLLDETERAISVRSDFRTTPAVFVGEPLASAKLVGDPTASEIGKAIKAAGGR